MPTNPQPTGNVFVNFEPFSDASDDALALLQQIAVRRSYEAKTVIVREGETDPSFYAVLDGLLQVTVQGSDGREIVLSLLRSLDTFGELALFDRAPRSATVTTLKRTELFVFPADALLHAVRRHPEVCFKMLCSMSALVRRLTRRVEELSAVPLPVRLARKLIEIGEICGTEIDANLLALPAVLSQQDLANHIQVTRESVNKHISSWLKDGILVRSDAQLMIRDRRRLGLIAEGKPTSV